MSTAVGLTISKTGSGQTQRSNGSGRNETPVEVRTITVYTVGLECILNGLYWRRFVFTRRTQTQTSANETAEHEKCEQRWSP